MTNRTIAIKLNLTNEQEIVLQNTMNISRLCFNQIAQYGWDNNERNQVELHKATYYQLRDLYPTFPAQLIISATGKAKEALSAVNSLKKKGEKVSCPNQKYGSIRYDARSYSIIDNQISIATIAGRLKFPLDLHWQAKHWWDKASKYTSADLVKRKSGKWYLNIVLDIPDVVSQPSGKVIGVDLGINRPAVTSDNQFLGNRSWKENENRYFRLKRSLHSKGTKSAKRHLKKISGKQRRFRKNCDHVISKLVINNLEAGDVLAIEKLTDIRKKTKQKGAKQRRKHHSWSYAQLRSFFEYKAETKGCKVVAVDPRNTSRTCSSCGVVDKKSRICQSVFKCVSCRYELNADLNAARNVKKKYLAQIDKLDLCGLMSTSLLFPASLVEEQAASFRGR
jgi:IS605 OrfB family transposase